MLLPHPEDLLYSGILAADDHLVGYHCHSDTDQPSYSDRRQVASHPPIENR